MSGTFEQIVHHLDVITVQEKYALRELLDQQLAGNGKNGSNASNISAFGWAKDRMTISGDFDAPLDDFEDYSE